MDEIASVSPPCCFASSTISAESMFDSIMTKSNVFYRSQQKGDDELDRAQKVTILDDLYQKKPIIFLQRYHQYIEPRFIPLFEEKGICEKYYLDRIREQAQINAKRDQLIKNRRYLAMQELHREGSYFSNEKMREREPYAFDVMVGQYLDDKEKLCLRPTVEITDSNRSEFSKLLEQFDDSQRVADRRKRYLETFQDFISDSDNTGRFMSHVEHRTVEADEEEKELDAEFQMEFDSSDEEGQEKERSRIQTLARKPKHCAKNDDTVLMRRFINRNVIKQKSEDERASEHLAQLRVSNRTVLASELEEPDEEAKWSSGDEDESRPTGLLRDQLYEEFVSMMEQRFLDGKDTQFFDYSKVDEEQSDRIDRIREQDMEDAYFDSEEPT